MIIYLDIDGVLVSYEDLKNIDISGEKNFKQEAVDALNEIISFYGADISLISSWNSSHDVGDYKRLFHKRGLKFNNIFIGQSDNREKYIVSEILKGVDDYIIIDDEAYDYYKSNLIEYKRIIQPNRYRCLDRYDAKKAIEWIS